MEQRKRILLDHITALLPCLLLYFSRSASAEAYKNHTVGDLLGWYDNLKEPDVNYQKWASRKVFSLGDFLIFNTDTNHSVIQTYNTTIYDLCDYEDSADNDTMEWSAADPSSTSPQVVTVAVPLVREGSNFFFSGNYDGEQCKQGQHFKINVTHGHGLPKSLQSSSDSAPGPAQSDGDNESAPDTVVSTDFSHPQSGSDDKGDKEDSGSGCKSVSGLAWLGGLVLFGLMD